MKEKKYKVSLKLEGVISEEMADTNSGETSNEFTVAGCDTDYIVDATCPEEAYHKAKKRFMEEIV